MRPITPLLVRPDHDDTAAMMHGMQTAHGPVQVFWSGTRGLRSLVVVLIVAVGGLTAQTQKPATTPKNRLATAIDLTLAQGHDAILPPHVSNLLGISPQEQEVPVKQFVEMGEPIRGFEVSSAEHNNVVIFVENRAQKQTTFYLMSRHGTLRKVLAVIGGVGYARVPTKDDRAGFDLEKKQWVERLAGK